MKLRRLLSCMMALLLACSLPLSAFAAEYDLAKGSVIVNASESGQTVTHGSNAAVPDSAPVITQSNSSTPTSNTITINADAGATANVTLSGVNINTSGAAVEIKGNGDVVIELDGSNTVQSGDNHAGVEKNNSGNLTITDENGTDGSLEATGGDCGSGIGGGNGGSGSDITITGNAEVAAQGGRDGAGIGGGFYSEGINITITGSAEVTATGGLGGSGIGGGFYGSGSDITITGNANVDATGSIGGSGIGGGDGGGSGNDITISGSAEVTAQGGNAASGIGGGWNGTGSDITISGDAQVKAQGGNRFNKNNSKYFSAGAAIGNGGTVQNGSYPDPGAEVDPDISKLTSNGKIEYYAPGADMNTAKPIKTVPEAVEPSTPAAEAAQPLYRVIGQDGKAISCKEARSSGVLTITVDADFATLTGSLSGLKTLKAQGVETVVFVTTGAISTFAIADLLAQGSSTDTYALTHVGSTVTLILGNGVDISSILK